MGQQTARRAAAGGAGGRGAGGRGAAPAPAAVLFVDQNHPQAADANPGTAEQPFKSIGAGLARLQAGDTLWVRKGVYREDVHLKRENDRDEPRVTTIAAWPGEEVVVKGSDVVTGWKTHEGKVWVKEGFRKTVSANQVFVDGALLQEIGGSVPEWVTIWWKGRKGDALKDMEPGSFFHDEKEQKLYVWLRDGGDPHAHLVEASVRNVVAILTLSHARISGFRLMHGGWYALWLTGHYNEVQDVTGEWNSFGGMATHGSNNTFLRCKWNHSGCVGIEASGWGHRFLNGETSWNNYRRISSSWHSGGVKIIPMCHDTVMSGHVAAYNAGSPGIWFDVHCSNITIQNCVAHHNGCGIAYEVCERATIKNNVVYENSTRGIDCSGSSYVAVLHNLCYRNGDAGISLTPSYGRVDYLYGRGEKSVYAGGNNVVWGNILIDNAHPDLCPKGPDGTGNPWYQRPELILPREDDAIDAGNLSDYNLFYRSDGRPIPFWKGWDNLVGKDLAEWQRKSGNDRHSVIAKPLFVDLEKRDFRPAEGSPALWMVKPPMSVRFDALDRERPSGAFGVPRAYYTAGPFEPEPEVTKARLASAKPSPAGKYLLVPLPKARTEWLCTYGKKDLSSGTLFSAVNPLEFKGLGGGRMGIEVAGVPYTQQDASFALFLNGEKPDATVPLDALFKRLHLLFAVRDLGEGPAVRCAVRHGDGREVPLVWTAGKNLASSEGEWKGALTDNPKGCRTEVAWEGQGDGTVAGRPAKVPVRLFHAVWENDDPWHAVKQLEWKLLDAKARVYLLGVTLEAGE